MRRFIIAVIGFLFFSVTVNAQDEYFQGNDSIQKGDAFILFNDSLAVDSVTLAQDVIALGKTFHPDPNKAILYSAILPGLGQIYNKKYWKLPLVYGSLMGCVYAITWNNTQYSGYKNAFRDFQLKMDSDGKPLIGPDGLLTYETKGDSWIEYSKLMRRFPSERADFSDAQVNDFTNVLKNQRDRFRRYRDLSTFIGIGIYAIWVIDAYVDAQLFDFDVSDDLSMRVEPVILERTAISRQTVGLQWSVKF